MCNICDQNICTHLCQPALICMSISPFVCLHLFILLATICVGWPCQLLFLPPPFACIRTHSSRPALICMSIPPFVYPPFACIHLHSPAPHYPSFTFAPPACLCSHLIVLAHSCLHVLSSVCLSSLVHSHLFVPNQLCWFLPTLICPLFVLTQACSWLPSLSFVLVSNT